MSTFIMKPYCSLYYVSPPFLAMILSAEISKRAYSPPSSSARRKTRPRYTCGLECAERREESGLGIIRCDAIRRAPTPRVIVMTARLRFFLFLYLSLARFGVGLLRQKGDVFGWLILLAR